MKRICLVVDNDIRYDSRVQRVRQSLSKAYEVITVGFSDDNVEALDEDVIVASSSTYKTASKALRRIFSHIRNQKIIDLPHQDDETAKDISSFASQPASVRDYLLDETRNMRFQMKKHSIHRVVSKIDADVYHANDLPVLSICKEEAMKKGAKLVYDSHELYLEQGVFRTRRMNGIYFRLEQEGIERADAVITVNEFIAKELQERYKLVSKPYVVYNCPRKTANKYARHTNGSPIRLLYQGKYSSGRGLKELVESLSLLPEGYELHLRGFGEYENHLRNLALSKGLLGKRVFFHEPVSMHDILAQASLADVGILIYEAYCLNNYLASPNKLFEYIGAGLAIFCNKLPFLQKIVDTYSVGSYVDLITPESLAKGISGFTTLNVQAYKDAAVAASNVLTWENEERKLLSIYDRIL